MRQGPYNISSAEGPEYLDFSFPLLKNLMMAASTIAVEGAALPITPTTHDETETAIFLAKKVKKKAPVRPRHCSYLPSWFVLLRRSPELMLSAEHADNVFRVGIERQ
jgi:hypothetical protein